jgi:hypothetical protein
MASFAGFDDDDAVDHDDVLQAPNPWATIDSEDDDSSDGFDKPEVPSKIVAAAPTVPVRTTSATPSSQFVVTPAPVSSSTTPSNGAAFVSLTKENALVGLVENKADAFANLPRLTGTVSVEKPKQKLAPAVSTASLSSSSSSTSSSSTSPSSSSTSSVNPSSSTFILSVDGQPSGGGSSGIAADADVTNVQSQKDENARRTKAVASTLSSKLASVQEEARKLRFIEVELRKLDQSLTTNINLLRQQIESVDRDVATAQRTFKKRETEYVAAKTTLVKAMERKKLLTGHLELIIVHNEKEKSCKLQELMTQLGMDGDVATAAMQETVAAAETSSFGVVNGSNGGGTGDKSRATAPFSASEVANFKV